MEIFNAGKKVAIICKSKKILKARNSQISKVEIFKAGQKVAAAVTFKGKKYSKARHNQRQDLSNYLKGGHIQNRRKKKLKEKSQKRPKRKKVVNCNLFFHGNTRWGSQGNQGTK